MIRLSAIRVGVILALGPCSKSEPPAPVEAPAPVLSATTPPIYQPPDPTPVGSASSAPAAASLSPDFPRAKAAADAKDWKKVRGFLEKRARAGKSPAEEAQLALDACIALKDKACADAIHGKYPDLLAR